MYDTNFFSGVTKFLKGLTTDTASAVSTAQSAAGAADSAEKSAAAAKTATDTLTKTHVYTFQVTTGADGTALVDYTSLGLTRVPRVTFMAQLLATDLPVFCDIVGTPTKVGCTVRVRRLTSILNLVLLSSYTGVASLKLDVYVRPAS